MNFMSDVGMYNCATISFCHLKYASNLCIERKCSYCMNIYKYQYVLQPNKTRRPSKLLKKKPKKTFFYAQIFLASNFLLLATLKNISKFNVLHEIRMNLAFKAINYKMFKLFVVHELWQPFLNIKSKNVMWLSLEMRCW